MAPTDEPAYTRPTTEQLLTRIREVLATLTDDPEVCHSAEDVLARMPQTVSELQPGTHYCFTDLVRWAAHDLYRDNH